MATDVEVIRKAMGLLDEAAMVGLSLDTFRRHEICGRLVEAHMLLGAVIPKENGARETRMTEELAT